MTDRRTRSFTTVDPNRLISPADDFKSAFPGLNFTNRRNLVTAGEDLLLVDPTYIADVYNSTDEVAAFLREHGLFLIPDYSRAL